MNQRKVSTRYYLFEDVLWETTSFAHIRQRRPIGELQFFAELVWKAEKGKGKCPLVKTKKRNDFSYYDHQDRLIVLARKHRSLGGLLHELAHALGNFDKLTHGPAFRKRCFRLYEAYGEWDGRVTFP
jgi:hypothetical protein